ncbi:hypothetical protein, partial [Pectinatus frisingensis]|uniref:hypothetical protein n=1 Tax=Pectinatus frisingensis TaxID=865 RepID=UPI0018C6B983
DCHILDKRVTVSWLEKSGNTITEQNKKIICDKFHISMHWFETGEGEMYALDAPFDIFDSMRKELNLSDVKEKILRGYFNLDTHSRKAVTDFIVNIGHSTAQTEDNRRITERNKAHVLLDQELDAEEKDVSALDAGNKKRA